MAALRQTASAPFFRIPLLGFVLSGALLAFPGAILPSWGYHLSSDFTTVGEYFLAVAAGVLLSFAIPSGPGTKRSAHGVLLTACFLAAAGFLCLSAAAILEWHSFRFVGLLCLGLSAGLLNAAVFLSIESLDEQQRAFTVNLAGFLFGAGSVFTALAVAGSYYVYTVPTILVFFALASLLFAGIFWRLRESGEAGVPISLPRQGWRELLNPAFFLFALLLFFQFSNEWSIAGWLSLYLIRRLGMSPESSLLLLSVYFSALLLGRLAVQMIARGARHGTLLIATTLLSLLGCVILTGTSNRFGAVMGILFIGSGFAAVYPLAAAKVADRLPSYHSHAYHRVITIAFAGGLLAPALAGFLADTFGIQVVFTLPLLGTCVVALLSLLIVVESRFGALPNAKRARV